ncbi:MAG: 4Fe-4S dicluster domain-containing protein [Lachnospiraceae bacterium]|nr:4Fe-4S dicluster domain-containing protein [Lachnospiraceae bacterium]
MLTASNDIGAVKSEVLYEVAKLAFEGSLAEKQEALPYEMIPGPHAYFRCCVYKEREIIRQRIRMAQGLSPINSEQSTRLIQVIPSACEGCPITRFVVTDNCQKCMAKKCKNACNFDAISMLRDRAYIDSTKCKECGRCAQACPYNAIADLMRPCKRSCPVDAISMDDNGICSIDETKCINCGNCIKNCPFGAISDRSSIVDVIKLLKSSKQVYAMVAPAIEGQFGAEVNVGMISEALKELGFTGMYEVALGADLVSMSETEEWAEAYKEGKKLTTSCCPAFVNMIHKHFPALLKHISTTISPMHMTARIIRELHPGAVTVFIGPCIAKKDEAGAQKSEGNADYVLTFEELHAMFRARDINLAAYSETMQQSTIYGKNYAVSGGVTKAVMQSLKEKSIDASDIQINVCNGAAECKKALMLLRAGKLPEDFIEGMACIGGCVEGPGNHLTGRAAQLNRQKLLSAADTSKNISDIVEAHKELPLSTHHEA